VEEMQTVQEFAEEWKVHVNTVYRWIADGRVKAKKIGRVVRIVSASVTDIETQKVEKIIPRQRLISRAKVRETFARFGR
jgi:excisionase family DNA binding protein